MGRMGDIVGSQWLDGIREHKQDAGRPGPELHLRVKLGPDPRYIFWFKYETLLSPQIVQIQGTIEQPYLVASLAGTGDRSKPLVQLAMRHIMCVEDAAIFMALAAAVDLSIEPCRLFRRKAKKGIKHSLLSEHRHGCGHCKSCTNRCEILCP